MAERQSLDMCERVSKGCWDSASSIVAPPLSRTVFGSRRARSRRRRATPDTRTFPVRPHFVLQMTLIRAPAAAPDTTRSAIRSALTSAATVNKAVGGGVLGLAFTVSTSEPQALAAAALPLSPLYLACQ